MRDIQRGSQSYMEKRRGKKEIEVTRMRCGDMGKEEGGGFRMENTCIPVADSC